MLSWSPVRLHTTARMGSSIPVRARAASDASATDVPGLQKCIQFRTADYHDPDDIQPQHEHQHRPERRVDAETGAEEGDVEGKMRRTATNNPPRQRARRPGAG